MRLIKKEEQLLKEKGYFCGGPSRWLPNHISACTLHAAARSERRHTIQRALPEPQLVCSQPRLSPTPSTAVSGQLLLETLESAFGLSDFMPISVLLSVGTCWMMCCHFAPRGSHKFMKKLCPSPSTGLAHVRSSLWGCSCQDYIRKGATRHLAPHEPPEMKAGDPCLNQES